LCLPAKITGRNRGTKSSVDVPPDGPVSQEWGISTSVQLPCQHFCSRTTPSPLFREPARGLSLRAFVRWLSARPDTGREAVRPINQSQHICISDPIYLAGLAPIIGERLFKPGIFAVSCFPNFFLMMYGSIANSAKEGRGSFQSKTDSTRVFFSDFQ